VIADVPVRHLQVSVDASLLVDAHLPMPTLDPVTGLPVADPLAVPVAADPLAAPVATNDPLVTDPTRAGEVQIEIWVDSNGLIRQITGAPQLGAEIITVNSTSEQAYIPTFPGPELVQPLTASALVELGM
jgi:hypothetical protein